MVVLKIKQSHPNPSESVWSYSTWSWCRWQISSWISSLLVSPSWNWNSSQQTESKTNGHKPEEEWHQPWKVGWMCTSFKLHFHTPCAGGADSHGAALNQKVKCSQKQRYQCHLSSRVTSIKWKAWDKFPSLLTKTQFGKGQRKTSKIRSVVVVRVLTTHYTWDHTHANNIALFEPSCRFWSCWLSTRNVISPVKIGVLGADILGTLFFIWPMIWSDFEILHDHWY